jgi:MoaA/NifB/PqqE/SkfB family radical SAM enzyme
MDILAQIFKRRNKLFYSDNKVEAIHLEMTSRCNASCPQCARNVLGGKENPYLPQTELSLEDIKNILPPKKVKELKRLYMCGNFGDPIVAKDTLETFRYLRENNNNMTLALNTNASARNEKWWAELAKIIDGKGNVKFGIDGLEDTHRLYRIGTDYSKILKNAKAFIDNGGNAIWEFLVFKHNEHQVEDARKLSIEMGFSKFHLKKTGRFFSNKTDSSSDRQEVLDKNDKVLYYLETPNKKELQNKSVQKEDLLIQKFGSMNNYFDSTAIDCKVLKENSVYISSEGLVFPCCWTAIQLYSWYSDPKKTQISRLITNLKDPSKINAKKNDISNIIKSEFFNKIKESWSCNSVKDGKIKVCAKTCGTAFDQFRDQYK